MEEKLIAPCGMNCSLCIAYQCREKDPNKQGLRRKYCPTCSDLTRCHNGLCMHCTLDTLLQNKKYSWMRQNELENEVVVWKTGQWSCHRHNRKNSSIF